MVANFSIQEVLEMVARDKEMDVDVEEKANEETSIFLSTLACQCLSHCTTLVVEELQVYL